MRLFLDFILAILFFLVSGNSSFLCAQSRIDSIEAEVQALNKDYQRELNRLYHQMLDACNDPAVPREERYRAKMLFHLFPIEENMERLLDSIGFHRFSLEDLFSEEYPYWYSYGVMIHENGEGNPGVINKIMKKLDAPHSDDELFLFSLLFQTYFHWSIIKSLNNKEKAACLRIMANSIRGVSQRKENLLKIADILESR